jgi:hypothetical protein
MVVFNAVQHLFPQWIKDNYDLLLLLRSLPKGEVAAFLDAMQSKLPEWITNEFELCWTLQSVSDKEYSAVINALQNQWPQLIQNFSDLESVLSRLSQKGRIAVMNSDAIKDQWPRWIQSASDLSIALPYLSPEQHAIFLRDAAQILLNKPIKDRHEFYNLLNNSFSNNIISPETVGEDINLTNELLQAYITKLLARPASSTDFLMKPLSREASSKLSAALWFQAILCGKAKKDIADFKKHLPALKEGGLGSIVKDTVLFKSLTNENCGNSIAELKENIHELKASEHATPPKAPTFKVCK